MNELPIFQPFVSGSDLGAEVLAGLMSNPKTLPCKYLYDGVGSSLFEAITHLREYACSRGEKALLEAHRSQIMGAVGGAPEFVELGGGTGEKAFLLLSTATQTGIRYHNLDISETALDISANVIKSLDNVTFYGHAGEFFEGLPVALRNRRGPVTVLFLGSSIGNFTVSESNKFLTDLRSNLERGDFLLLGTDLEKPVDRLVMAYDDPQGVTSAFNKNLLARINYELSANFDLSKFAHEARWNQPDGCIEMHLRSLVDQAVRISRLKLICSFSEGETIRTERSHKYRGGIIGGWLSSAGWELSEQWIDQPSLFALNLACAA